MSEVQQALQDPTAAVNIVVGPPVADLVAQDPNVSPGVRFAGLYEHEPRRFVFKKAHLSREDFRIFDSHPSGMGQLVCVSHHHGKNPYESLDPLGLSTQPHVHHGQLGEMESLCQVTGYKGVPSFKIRPKTLSMHGRQLCQDMRTRETIFSVAKISRIKTMSLRHNLEVCVGDSDEETYIIEADLMGRTLVFKNKRDEMVAFAQKSTKALITSQLFGAGSEMLVDVAAGVDWSAICAIMMCVQQVGAHYLKDLFDMLVMEPATDAIVDQAVDATGTQGMVNAYTSMQHQAQRYTMGGQNMYNQFQHQR